MKLLMPFIAFIVIVVLTNEEIAQGLFNLFVATN
jgi:hypothetical protein